MANPLPDHPVGAGRLGFLISDSDEGIPLLFGDHVRPATVEEKKLWDALQEVASSVSALVAALEELAEWGANREHHSAVSDLNRDEERGWNLALSGLEYWCRQALATHSQESGTDG